MTNVHLHTEYVDGCHRCELNQDEARSCDAETYPQVNYLPNGDPGYPAEYCENDALPGEQYCAQHMPTDDADRAYEEWRDLQLEAADKEMGL